MQERQNNVVALAAHVPYNREAEQQILSAIFYDQSVLDAIRTKIKPFSFYSPDHRAIFAAMISLQEQGKTIDIITVQETLPPRVVEWDYLVMLIDHAWTAVGLDEHIEIVKNHAMKRKAADPIKALAEHNLNGKSPAMLRAEAMQIAELYEDDAVETSDGFEPLADLFLEPDVATEWVLDGLLPCGATSILGARPGSGKSSIARNLAMCVADGLPFLGRPVKQGPVLVAALEENKSMVVKAFRTMGATGNNIHIRSMDMTDGVETLRAAIKRVGAILLVVDTLGDLFADVNDHKVMKPALHQLHNLAEDTGVHIFIVHHDRKGDTGPDSLLGSVAIGGGPDSSWLLDSNFETGQRVLRTLKQRYPDGESIPPTIIGFDPDTYRVTDLGSKSEAVRKGFEERILDELADQPEPMKRVALLKAVGGNRGNAVKALHNLVGVLKVDQLQDGRGLGYQLHTAGN